MDPNLSPEERLIEVYERAYKTLLNLCRQTVDNEITREDLHKMLLTVIEDVSFYEGFTEQTLKSKGRDYRKRSLLLQWYNRRTG
jgi:hypothetical protein